MNLLLLLLLAVLGSLAWVHRPARQDDGDPVGTALKSRNRFAGRFLLLKKLSQRISQSLRTKSVARRFLAVAAVVIAFAGGPVMLLALGGCGVAWHWKKRSSQRQDQNIIGDLAEVLDLFLLGTSAGLTVWLTLEEVSKHARGRLGETLQEAVRRVNLGASLTETLEWLSRQHNGQLRLLTRPLIEAERYGVALEPSLLRAREEARQLRRRQAEAAARRVPVKLMFPLVLCILPAFGLLTVVPQLVSTLNLLRTPS